MSNEESNTDRKKVLVIDDEKDLREALFTAIAAEGYEVFAAEDGVKGLELAFSEKPDVILLDLIMPNLGGQGVLEKLQEDDWGKTVKVIVLTALDDMETLSKILETGMVDYLVKSDVQLDDIVKKINEKF